MNHHYASRVAIDGNDGLIRVIVREENGNLFYDSHVSSGEIIKKIFAETSSAFSTAAEFGENLSKDRILQWLYDVNRINRETTTKPN